MQNEAALFWRAKGNGTRALSCLRHALRVAPPQHRDLCLLNAANLLLHHGLPEEADPLLREALALNASEVSPLGGALESKQMLYRTVSDMLGRRRPNLTPGHLSTSPASVLAEPGHHVPLPGEPHGRTGGVSPRSIPAGQLWAVSHQPSPPALPAVLPIPVQPDTPPLSR